MKKVKKTKSLYVEKRPQGDFAVRKAASSRASAVAKTQKKAIKRAKKLAPGTSPRVERVRKSAKGKPDQWRKA